MNITIDIKPGVQAALAQKAIVLGRPLEVVAAALLEGAVDASPLPLASTEPVQLECRTGQALVDAFADIRGLLTDEEVDQMFRRNNSTARRVDLP